MPGLCADNRSVEEEDKKALSNITKPEEGSGTSPQHQRQTRSTKQGLAQTVNKNMFHCTLLYGKYNTGIHYH